MFDFSAFNPETYSERLPGSSWQEFVPCCSKWKEAVWIEIDAVVLGRALEADRGDAAGYGEAGRTVGHQWRVPV